MNEIPEVNIKVTRKRFNAGKYKDYTMVVHILPDRPLRVKAQHSNRHKSVLVNKTHGLFKPNQIWRCEPVFSIPYPKYVKKPYSGMRGGRRWEIIIVRRGFFHRWVSLTTWYKRSQLGRTIIGKEVRLPSGWTYTRTVETFFGAGDLGDISEMLKEKK